MPLKLLQIDDVTQTALSEISSDSNLTLALAHSVYTLAAEDVRQGLWRPIGPIATRILGLQGEEAKSAYEVSAGPDGMPHMTHQTLSSPYVQGTLEAVRRADILVGTREVEFRLLRVPFLFFVGAWLAPDDISGDDTIIPIAPSPGGIEEMVPVSVSHLIDRLRRLPAQPHGSFLG